MVSRYDRIASLLGNNFQKLQDAKVLLLGVGGVGGICLDCLYRSGIKDITIVDFDRFEITNLNRQLHSESFLNQSKVASFALYYTGIKTIDTKIDPQWVREFDFSDYDIILDAIDDIKAKVALANKCHTKLISSLGSAKRVDPSKIVVDSIWKSYGDKFASKFRYELRKSGFNGDFSTIFSTEEPKIKELGSFMGVTGSFGLMLCSLAIKRLIK